MKVKASGMERMFGMSPNGIRLYEKQGVIRPQREESGYRTYGVTELLAMEEKELASARFMASSLPPPSSFS